MTTKGESAGVDAQGDLELAAQNAHVKMENFNLKRELAAARSEIADLLRQLEQQKATASETSEAVSSAHDTSQALDQRLSDLKDEMDAMTTRIDGVVKNVAAMGEQSLPPPRLAGLSVSLLAVEVDGLADFLKRDVDKCASTLVEMDTTIRAQLKHFPAYMLHQRAHSWVVAFHAPEAAMDAACLLQKTAEKSDGAKGRRKKDKKDRMRLRIGIHCGVIRAQTDEETGSLVYYGEAIQTAIQVAKCAHGAQTLITAKVRTLLLPYINSLGNAGAIIKMLGTFAVQGHNEPLALAQLLPRELQYYTFSPVRSAKEIAMDETNACIVSFLETHAQEARQLGVECKEAQGDVWTLHHQYMTLCKNTRRALGRLKNLQSFLVQNGNEQEYLATCAKIARLESDQMDLHHQFNRSQLVTQRIDKKLAELVLLMERESKFLSSERLAEPPVNYATVVEELRASLEDRQHTIVTLEMDREQLLGEIASFVRVSNTKQHYFKLDRTLPENAQRLAESQETCATRLRRSRSTRMSLSKSWDGGDHSRKGRRSPNRLDTSVNRLDTSVNKLDTSVNKLDASLPALTLSVDSARKKHRRSLSSAGSYPTSQELREPEKSSLSRTTSMPTGVHARVKLASIEGPKDTIHDKRVLEHRKLLDDATDPNQQDRSRLTLSVSSLK